MVIDPKELKTLASETFFQKKLQSRKQRVLETVMKLIYLFSNINIFIKNMHKIQLKLTNAKVDKKIVVVAIIILLQNKPHEPIVRYIMKIFNIKYYEINISV